MAAGLSDKLNILKQSPLDAGRRPRDEEDAGTELVGRRWLPSRYNVRARTEDGGLVVWNSFHGTMSVFGSEQREEIEAYLRRPGFTGGKEGMVEYLADRGFLVEEGTDEYRQLRLAFGQQQYRSDLLELILLASEDCNFRCTYCYEDFNRGTMKPWVRDAVKKLVTKRIPTLRALRIDWFGGEPLYGFDAVEDLAPFFVEMADRHSIRLIGSMTTNGYLLTPEIARKLLDWKVKSFQITVDGPAETHDRSRPTRNGQGTFHVILDNLRAMKTLDEEFLVSLRVNFDRSNHREIPRFLDIVSEELGNDRRFRLRFHAVGQWGGPNDAELDVCGDDEGPILVQLREEARRRGLAGAGGMSAVRGLGSEVCYAARPYNFIVGAEGDLMKCTIDLDKKDRNLVGRLTPEGRVELDKDKFARWTEPAFENDAKCQKCVVLPTCQGIHCPQIRFDENRSPCTPLRMNAKQELRSAWAAAKGRQRKVTVEVSEPERRRDAAS